jgi:DNA-binding transcriptional ArsR family regulator
MDINMAKLLPVKFAKALADETRQKIMKLCCCQWLSVTEIVDQLDVAQPTVSHHLAILRDAGLVDIRPDGKQTFYTLNQERVVMCCGNIMNVFAPEEEATKTLNKMECADSRLVSAREAKDKPGCECN